MLHHDRLEIRVDLREQGPVSGHPLRRTVQGLGAVVLCARVALAAQGWAVQVDRLPRPDDPELLAILRPAAGAPEAGLAPLAALASAGPLRGRRPRVRPLPPGLLQRLGRVAALEDSLLVPVTSDAARELVEQLDHEASSILGRGPGEGTVDPRPADTAQGALLLLTTMEDDELAWLRSGEAMERVLLGLARESRFASLVTEVLDVPFLRTRVRSGLCWPDHPQALIRVG
ncbi:MAG: hypothetical protein JHC71_02750 [Blastococcus sp.]|nr:hypothetical protein [Blastococcus sp.]